MNSSHRLRKAFLANSTASSFATLTPQSFNPKYTSATDQTAPDGFFDLAVTGNYSAESEAPEYLHIQPYVVGADGDTFSLRVYGWASINPTTGSAPNVSQIWSPVLLCELACTAGNIAGTAIAANTFMADTINATYGGDDLNIISPANDLPASAILHLRGFHLIQFDFKKGAGTLTGMNALWKPLHSKQAV